MSNFAHHSRRSYARTRSHAGEGAAIGTTLGMIAGSFFGVPAVGAALGGAIGGGIQNLAETGDVFGGGGGSGGGSGSGSGTGSGQGSGTGGTGSNMDDTGGRSTNQTTAETILRDFGAVPAQLQRVVAGQLSGMQVPVNQAPSILGSLGGAIPDAGGGLPFLADVITQKLSALGRNP